MFPSPPTKPEEIETNNVSASGENLPSLLNFFDETRAAFRALAESARFAL
jgi:hypothetical protein